MLQEQHHTKTTKMAGTAGGSSTIPPDGGSNQATLQPEVKVCLCVFAALQAIATTRTKFLRMPSTG